MGTSRGRGRSLLARRLALGAAGALAAAGVLGVAASAGAATTAKTKTVTYTTAGSHVFQVPAGVTQISVTAVGGAGGSCAVSEGAALGGEGASVTATFPVKPGAKLFVGVAGAGGVCTEDFTGSSTVPGGAGGAEGGGTGGSGDAGGISGAGGGGASGVGLKSLAAGGSPLIVAAGGGGASYCEGTGGSAGSAGQPGISCSPFYGQGGGAGSTTSGGTGGQPGTYTDQTGTYDGTAGANGSAGTGGSGGAGTPSFPSASGGGAGGGYYGGGGGGGGAFESGGGGGGGGASFTATHATDVTAATPTTSSAGVTITYTAPSKPKAMTKRATGVTHAGAKLHGSINAEGQKTTYVFEYGTSKKYGRSTARHKLAASRSAKNVAAVLTGLKPGTTYHFRVVAKSAGGTALGRDMTFHTASVAPAFTG